MVERRQQIVRSSATGERIASPGPARAEVFFCPLCALQVALDSGSGNECCRKNRKRVYADSIVLNDQGWQFEETKGTKKMARQTSIPGTERKRNPKLAEAMEGYKKARDASIRAGNRANEAKQELLTLAAKFKSELTEVDDELVFIDDESGLKLIYSNKENVKIRTLKDDADEGEGAEA